MTRVDAPLRRCNLYSPMPTESSMVSWLSRQDHQREYRFPHFMIKQLGRSDGGWKAQISLAFYWHLHHAFPSLPVPGQLSAVFRQIETPADILRFWPPHPAVDIAYYRTAENREVISRWIQNSTGQNLDCVVRLFDVRATIPCVIQCHLVFHQHVGLSPSLSLSGETT